MNKTLFSNRNNKMWSMAEASAKSSVRKFAPVCVPELSAETGPVWREIELRTGLRVSSFESTLPHKFSFSYQKKNSFLDFGFFLEGTIINNLYETSIGPHRLENLAGHGGLGFFREMSGRVESTTPVKARIIHLHISPELLHELLFEDIHAVHDDLKNLLENKVD